MRFNIGIIGATGTLGKKVTYTLLKRGSYSLYLGIRNIEKAKSILGEEVVKKYGCKLDIYQQNQLKEFCSKCDYIINCVGPSSVIKDSVARMCLDACTNYVDIGGGISLYKLIARMEKEICDKKLIFLIGAGVYPGLSEIFPRFLSRRMSQIDIYEEFFAGIGNFSQNAAYDIVCGISEENGSGMAWIDEGMIKKGGNLHHSYLFPEPLGKLDTYPVISEEFLITIKKCEISKAYFYNTYPSKDIFNQFIKIGALRLYRTEEEKINSAHALIKAYSKIEENKKAYTMFYIRCKGYLERKYGWLTTIFSYNGNWNDLSGIVAGKLVELIIEQPEKKVGCYFASQTVDSEKIIKELKEDTNITITEQFREEDINVGN